MDRAFQRLEDHRDLAPTGRGDQAPRIAPTQRRLGADYQGLGSPAGTSAVRTRVRRGSGSPRYTGIVYYGRRDSVVRGRGNRAIFWQCQQQVRAAYPEHRVEGRPAETETVDLVARLDDLKIPPGNDSTP